jgi:uncharacterized protein GlcG (DUF336 family)
MHLRNYILALLASSLMLTASAHSAPKLELPMWLAFEAAEAAMRACTRRFEVSVAVVDRYGNLVAFMRNRRAKEATIQVSHSRATQAAYSGTTQGQVDALGIGLPMRAGGRQGTVVAAIGVSGGVKMEDNARCALIGKQNYENWYANRFHCEGACKYGPSRWETTLRGIER